MLKSATLFIGFCLSIGIWGPAAHAQTVNAASCDASAVQGALNSVNQATATVVIPAGTCAWSSAISYTVPSSVTSLTIQGQTTVNCTGTAGTSSYACTAGDNTVLVDATTNSGVSMLTITTGSSSTYFRMTGLTIEGGSTAKNNGIVDFQGSSNNFRFDHNHINAGGTNDQMIQIGGGAYIFGVIDHNVADLGNVYSVSNGFRIYNTDSPGYGDTAFSAPTNWGSSQFVFLESNVFNGGAPDDCGLSGRFVMRYNTINNTYVGVQTHPTKTYEGGYRGCRAYEAYRNYFGGNSAGNAALSTSSTTALVWGNTLASGAYQHLFVANTFRAQDRQPEFNTPGGWGYCGTDTLATSGTPNGVGSAWDGNSSSVTGYPCLDGVGRGQTLQTLNDEYFPNRRNLSTGTISWPQQYLEPVYLWMNTVSYGNEGYLSDSVTAYERDVYPDCGNPGSDCSSTFNGTKGTGYGTLASRPSTCTAGLGGTYGASPTGSYGVAYWATDANGGQGELYVCTSTNTWTAIYEPYAYPHPLVAGVAGDSSGSSSNAPTPPTNLSATVQ